MLSITINDTGKGIPEDGINKVFEPFYTTKRNGLEIEACNDKKELLRSTEEK